MRALATRVLAAGWGAMALCVLGATAPAIAAAGPITFSAPEAVSPQPLNAIVCPTASFCLAAGDHGQLTYSEAPRLGAGVWSTVVVARAGRLTSATCASPRFCAVADNHGDVAVGNPSDNGTWRLTSVDHSRWLNGISCPTRRLCLAVDRQGGVLVSSHPAAAHPGWTRVRPTHTALSSVSCPSASLCVATETRGRVLDSKHPRGGARAWFQRTIEPGRFSRLRQLSCPSTRLCVALGSPDFTDVQTLTSTHPTVRGPWRAHDLASFAHEGDLRGGVSCGSPQLCAAWAGSQFSSGEAFGSTSPGHRWLSNPFPGQEAPSSPFVSSVACGGASLCVLADRHGDVIVGSH